MKRKLLAILLTMAMVVTMIPAIFVTVTAEVAFVPQADAWFTENGYTAITDAAGLKAATMGTAPDAIAKYYLKNDIVVPAGTTGALMNDLSYIELDGNGHTISGVQASAPGGGDYPKLGGLANRVYGYTTVKNLNMTGTVTYTTETTNSLEIGGLFGCVNGLVAVENVHLNMTVTGSTKSYIGGLIGQTTNTGNTGMNVTGTERADTDVTFTNCSFAGEVKAGANFVGGLVGAVNNPKKFTAVDCVSNGKVTVTGGTSEPQVGGVIGYCSAVELVSLTGVVRNGNIVETNKSEGVGTGWARVGGFIGVVGSGAWDLDFVGCKNYGTLQGTNDIGGYVGVYYVDDSTDKATFVDCENYATASGANYGGFVAYVNNTDAAVYLDGCANYANISVTGNQISGFVRYTNACKVASLANCVNYGNISTTNNAAHVGSFLGYTSNTTKDVTFDGCVNYGDITAAKTYNYNYAGGIAGDFKTTGTLTVKNCANFGNITLHGGAPSGIVSTLHAVNAVVIQDCYNYGAMTNTTVGRSDYGAAGILCRMDGAATDVDITRCHNFGKLSSSVQGWSKAGGILGNAPNVVADITITGCSNFGAMEVYDYVANDDGAYSPEFGGITGTLGLASGAVLNISNCYSVGVVTEGSVAAATRTAEDYTLTATSISAICAGAGKATASVTNCASAYKLAEGTLTGKFGVNTSGNIEIDENTDLATVVETLGSAFVLDDGQIEPVYALNKVATQVYATQEAKDGAAGTVDVRVLALVNSLGYDKAGVNIYKVGNDTPVKTATTTTVYSGVINGEDTLYAPYGTYYLPITVKGINAEGTYTFVVETFVEKGEDVTPSDTYTIVVTDGEVVSAKKN